MVKKRVTLCGFISLSFIFALFPCLGAAHEESEAEMQSVLDRLDALESLVGKTGIGGWIDVAYKDTDREDAKKFFDVHHFYLFFDHKVNDNWRAFAELEYEHSPKFEGGKDGSGDIKLERGYIQYSHNDPLKIRIGKFNMPLGIWTPAHWAISVDTTEKPIHENNKYVPAKAVGLEFFGKVFLRPSQRLWATVDYSAFVSNGSEISGTNKPEDDLLAGGLDYNVTFNNRYLFGTSAYMQYNASPRLGGTVGRKEDSVMVYADAKLPYKITLRSEYFVQIRNKGDPDIQVVYAKVKWQFLDKWYVNYRWNYGDDEKNGEGEGLMTNTVTLAFWPHPQVRMKLEYNHHDFDDEDVEDYNAWSYWIGLVF